MKARACEASENDQVEVILGDVEEQKAPAPARTFDEIIKERISQRPWAKVMGSILSEANKVNKRKALLMMMSELIGREEASMNVIDLFEGEEHLLAIVLQNSAQPKNSNRTDAIKRGTYEEIKSLQ